MNPYYVMLLICIQSSHCNSSEVNITVYAESMPEKVTYKFLTSPLAAYQTCRTLKAEHVKGISSLYLVLSQKHSFHFPHCGSWQNTPVLSGIYQNPAQNQLVAVAALCMPGLTNTPRISSPFTNPATLHVFTSAHAAQVKIYSLERDLSWEQENWKVRDQRLNEFQFPSSLSTMGSTGEEKLCPHTLVNTVAASRGLHLLLRCDLSPSPSNLHGSLKHVLNVHSWGFSGFTPETTTLWEGCALYGQDPTDLFHKVHLCLQCVLTHRKTIMSYCKCRFCG